MLRVSNDFLRLWSSALFGAILSPNFTSVLNLIGLHSFLSNSVLLLLL